MPTTQSIAKFLTLTIILTISLGTILAVAFRASVAEHWSERKCDPGVVPIAFLFKPNKDPRTSGQFAEDNWKECQKEYVQNAIRVAASAPKELMEAEAAIASLATDAVEVTKDIFVDVWKFSYEAYETFMERIAGVAKLFQNFLINMHSLVDKLQASALSIVYGLISLTVAFISSVQVVLIVAIVIIGILIALQIILFFVLMPISGMIITITAIISVVAVSVATAIAAAMVSEMFVPGACFGSGTMISMNGPGPGPNLGKQIEKIKIGDVLADGGRVTAVHQFHFGKGSYSSMRMLHGVIVSDDHLVLSDEKRLIPVGEHPDAVTISPSLAKRLCGSRIWCLTTTTRRIPCIGLSGCCVMFADWEEIQGTDTTALHGWYTSVWKILNPYRAFQDPYERLISKRILQSESGIAPDSYIWKKGWLCNIPVRAEDIRIGDKILDINDEMTTVVGCVEIEGSMDEDVIQLKMNKSDPGIIVAAGTWVKWNYMWNPAGMLTITEKSERHIRKWLHFYTESGTFVVGKEHWCVRDASDIGLDNLKPLVDIFILTGSVEKSCSSDEIY